MHTFTISYYIHVILLCTPILSYHITHLHLYTLTTNMSILHYLHYLHHITYCYCLHLLLQATFYILAIYYIISYFPSHCVYRTCYHIRVEAVGDRTRARRRRPRVQRHTTLKRWATQELTSHDTSDTDQSIDNGHRFSREVNTDSDPCTTTANKPRTTNARRWIQRPYSHRTSQHHTTTLAMIPGNKRRLDDRPMRTTAHSNREILCKGLRIYTQCMVSNVFHIHD